MVTFANIKKITTPVKTWINYGT